MKRFLYIFIVLLCSQVVWASKPIQIFVQLQAPHSPYLYEYASIGSHKMSVQIQVLDSRLMNHPVRVEMYVEKLGQGIVLKTNPAANIPPMYLSGGTTTTHTGADLQAYFLPHNLLFLGIDPQLYRNERRLPDGQYKIGFRITDARRSEVVLSDISYSMPAWFMLNQPPIAQRPEQGSIVTPSDMQQLYVEWLPRHVGGLNAQFPVRYTVELFQIETPHISAEQIVRSIPPQFSANTSATNYTIRISDFPLELGKDYAIRILAQSAGGEEQLFLNGGYSNTLRFTYGSTCPIPTGLRATSTTHQSMDLAWNTHPLHSSYDLRICKADTDKPVWHTIASTHAQQSITSMLTPGYTYELQVRAVCMQELGAYSNSVRVSLPYKPPTQDFVCGQADTVKSTNRVPKSMLFEGEMLTYGQFPIQLTKISGGNGEFKGEGLMRVPYFNNARVRVTFESILVNELNQIYAGRVVSVYNPHSKFMVDDLGDYIPHNYQIGHIVDAKDSSEITLDYELLPPIVATMQGSTLRLQSQGGSSTHTIANAQHGTTLQDAAGKLYAVDANGTVRAIGKSADSNASKQAPPPKDSTVWLTFTAPNATWAIDYYDAAYSSKHYTQSYKTFEGEPIAWKFVALGKADRIELHIPPQAGIDHEQVQFVTTTGTELYADYSQNTYNLHIPSARSRDGYELIARLQHADSSYSTIAMLHVAAYELQTRSLVIVPMQEKNHPSAEEIAHGLNNIYAPYGVQWQVRVDDAFTDQSWDEGKQGLQTQGSEFFSTYTSEMKNLHSLYESQRGIDPRSAYIFWFTQKSESSERLLGDMPLESRYGYVFSKTLDQHAYQIGRAS